MKRKFTTRKKISNADEIYIGSLFILNKHNNLSQHRILYLVLEKSKYNNVDDMKQEIVNTYAEMLKMENTEDWKFSVELVSLKDFLAMAPTQNN